MRRVLRRRIIGLYRLFRFELPFTAGICVLLGELLALGGLPSVHQAIYGFLSVFFIAATALILNDYFDIETDRINAPSRPLPSGLVTKTEVKALAIGVALLGLFFSYLVGLQALAVAFAIWAVGFLYNWRLKRTGLWGNLSVAFSVGMTFIFGGIVTGNPYEVIVWYLATIAFLVDLGEEIAADALDIEGDREAGSRSLAVLRGPEQAMRIAAGVFAIVVAGSTIPFIFGWLEWFYIPVMAAWDGVIVYSVANLLHRGRSDRIKDIRRIYMSGLAMLLGFIAIRLATA